MDESKINQPEINLNSIVGEAKANLYTGRLLYCMNEVEIGLDSYSINLSHIYNSQYDLPEGVENHFSNKWKLNVEQYVYKENGNYYYIDANGSIIKFEELETDVYYDTSGLGFILVKLEDCIEIKDPSDSKMIFRDGKLVETISSEDQSLSKQLKYENNKLILIYDTRKPDTRIELSYSENSFLQEVIVIVKNKIQYKLKYYYENNNLVCISKIESGFEKEFILINYDINNYLKTIAYIDSGDALRFLYNEDNKINQIINGVVEINKIKCDEENSYLNENLYVGDKENVGDKINKYLYKIGENIDILNFNKISYIINNSQHIYSIVENEKNIKLAYYINDNGYLLSILEISDSINNLKTLEKKPGKSMLNEGCGNDDEIINTQNAFLVNTRTEISTDENGLMSGRLASLDEYRKNEYNSYKNYICSFWIKLLDELENSKIKLRIVSDKEDNADESIVSIDNTALNRWQEVRIPIKITYDSVKSINLEFLDEGQEKNYKIADMKLYYSFTNKTMITNGITPAYLDDVTFIKYKRKNNNNYSLLTFDDDTFITEKDLQMMYLSKFKSSNSEFKFYYNDCTKCVLVNEVILNALNTDYNIEFNDDNYTEIFNISNSRAQFFNESLSPDGDLYVYQIPYYVKNYEIDGEQHNCMILITEANRYVKENPDGSTPSEHIESYMMKCIDLNGKILFEQDEYGVQNIYKYDQYGTLISKILTSNKTNSERITENIVREFNEDNNSSIYATKKIINNYNFTNYIYNEKGNLISSEVSSENTQDARKKEYKYTLFDNKIKTIKNNNGELTNIKYNAKGNITEISPKKVNDDDYYSYKFQYDKFGKPNKLIYSYKDNGQEINKTLIIKNIDKENNTITTEYYNDELNPDKVTVLMNKYGNIENMDINGNKVTFTRQDLWESSGAANVQKIVDELDGKEYFYNYDDFNKLINYGYEDSKKDLLIEKYDNDDISTEINNTYENFDHKYLPIISTVTLDSNYLFNPRIFETNQSCSLDLFSDRVQYTYDELGRIKSRKRPSLYSLSETINSNEEFYYLDKSNYIANKSVVTKFYEDKCNHYFNSTYNEFGNVTSNNLKIEKNADDEDEKQELNYSRTYKYNKAGRIIEELDTLNNIKTEYSYNNDGSIAFYSVNGIKRYYNYDKGRLTSITEGGQINNSITYDNIGNIAQIGINEYKWERGNLLSEFKCSNDRTNFYYNGFGQKYRKILPNGVEINYVYDNDKLIGEYHSNGEYLIYTYDTMGVTGFWFYRIDSGNKHYLEYYYYIKDIQNNVRSIMKMNIEVAHYEYDCYGNCAITNYTDANIGNINPIRWKSMYCETECNLYFINNSTYSPELKQNISMITFDELINIEFDSNNLYAYQLITTNSFDLVYYQSDIDSQLELSYKPRSIPKWRTFLSELWKTTGGKLLAIFLTGLALVLSIAMFGWAGLIGFGITAAGVATSLIVGGIMAGVAGRKVGKGFYNGFINYLNENWSQTLGTQMLMYVVSISVLKITTDCFIEGTLVLASTGQVKIEDIKVGDEVWSYNHQTGKKELKKVKHIFRNKTKEWYHLHIFNQNTKKEEKITCTKNHRIYIKNKGYVVANKILEKDKVILYNGIEGLITRIEREELEEEKTTYNFEVEDNHNYYVSEECVLVHNDCLPDSYDVLKFDEAAVNKAMEGNPSFQTFKRRLFKYQKELTPNLFNKYKIGVNPYINGKKIILHHPRGRKGSNLYNVVGVTQQQHLKIHFKIGYRNPKWDLVIYNLGEGAF